MAYHFGGNAFQLFPGAADNSTNNLAGHNTMRPNGGAYGTTIYGGPMNSAPIAPQQHIPMGYPGLIQPMPAGMPTGQYLRQPVAQYPVAQGIPMATGPHYAPMPYGTYPHVPGTYFPAMQGLPMANAPLNAPMPYGMRPEGAYGHGALAGPPAFSEQRPAPLVSRADNMRAARNALLRMRAAPVPAPQAAAPREVVDLTNDNDDEPIAISSTPITQGASNKKRSADSTPQTAGKPAKKPRYSRFTGALPTPPLSSPVVHTTPAPSVPALSSAGSSVSPVVVPATPSPVSRTPAPKKNKADLAYLLGDIHRKFVEQPVNAQTAAPEAESSTPEPVEESIETAVAGSSTTPAPLPERAEAHVAESDAHSESDTDFEVDDEHVVQPAAVPAAVTPAADAATDVVDEDDEIVFDEDGNVLGDAQGQPLKRSVWLAQQAAAQPHEFELVETSAASDRAALAERLNASVLAAAETARQLAEMVAAGERETSRTKKSKKAAAPKKPAAPKKKRSPAPKKPVSSAPKKSAAAAPKKRSPSPVAESDDDMEAELQAAFDEEPTEEEIAAAAAYEQERQKVRELKEMLAQVSSKDELEQVLRAYH
jgi:hypothetical protein